MAADKSPAFQFYARDWLSSDSVSLMTAEQAGAYIMLLAHAWLKPDGLPAAMPLLAKLARVPVARFTRSIWPALVGCFHQDEHGHWFNARLEVERSKQEEFRQAASRAGKRSAEQRALNARSLSVDVPLQRKSNSSSSSASSSASAKEGEGADAPQQPPPQPIFGRRNPDLMTYGPVKLWASQFRDEIVPLVATHFGGDRDAATIPARDWIGELDAANQARTPSGDAVLQPAKWWSAQAAQRWATGTADVDRGVENILRGLAEAEAREAARKAARS